MTRVKGFGSRNIRNALAATVSAAAIAAFASAAGAQTVDDVADAQEEADRDPFFSDAIIVTAQRREQSIQDVPVAVTAVSGEQLEVIAATQVSDLEALTPGLVWGEGGTSQYPTIRGVITPIGENIGDPATAFFINGVYKSRTAQALAATVDLERAEVLRGPQGTLFGRNATAGAINIISRKPDLDGIDYRFSGSYGNYNAVEVTGMVNAPLGSDIAARSTVLYKKRDGFVENIGPSTDINDEDLFYMRNSLRYQPDDRFEAIARIAVLERHRKGAGGFTYTVLGQSFEIGRGRTIFGDPVSINPRVRDGIDDFVDGVNVGDIGVPVFGPYTIRTDLEPREDTTSVDLDLEMTYKLNFGTLRSITAYADFESIPFDDSDTDALPEVRNETSLLTAAAKTFTQELQLTSNEDSPVDWVVGAFYLNDKTFEIFALENLNGNPRLNRQGELTPLFFDRRTNVDTESIAFYGQTTVPLTDQFSVTGGIRYTKDTKDFKLREFGWLGVFGFNPDLDTTESFDKVTWRVGAEYQPTPNNLLYGSVATGFRSGGFNRFADAGATDANTFDSELITTYEIGSKNEFDGVLRRANLALYYSDLADQQVGTVISIAGVGQSGFFNAGETEIYGAELELQFQPTPDWYALATLAYNKSEYKEYTSPGFAGDTIGQPGVFADPETGRPFVDLAGNDTPRSPRFRATLLTGYDLDLANFGTITPVVNFLYSTGFYNTAFNTSLDRQDDFAKIDLRLRYTNPNETFSIEGFVQNVTDEAVLSRVVYGSNNEAFASYQDPRTYGLRVIVQR